MDIPSFEDLLKQIKINMWLSGIPFGDPKIHFRFYLITLNITLMIVEESGFFVVNCSAENFLKLTQLTPCICVGFLSVLKFIPIVVNRHKIFDITESLKGLYALILEKDEQIKLVRQNIVTMNKILKYFIVLNIILVSVYNLASVVLMLIVYFNKNKIVYVLPYDVIEPFRTDTFLTWGIVYIHSISCGYICVLFFTTVDGLYYVLTLHICNNFALLSNDIKSLKEFNCNRLRYIVKQHQYLLKLSEDLEEIFRLPNLFNVLVGSLEICALGFNLTMGDWAQVPGCVLFLFSVLIQILMMSIFGENLIRESRRVGESAFLSKWYNMDENSKKTILIIMKRSNKPQRLTAYKFSVISYESFTKIISTSWSYFTILRTVYKPPETASNE